MKIFRKKKLVNFLSIDRYQYLIKQLVEDTIKVSSPSATVVKIYEFGETLSKIDDDLGLKFLGSLLKFTVSGPELLRITLSDLSNRSDLRKDLLNQRNLTMREIEKAYAWSDLPRGYDAVVRFFEKFCGDEFLSVSEEYSIMSKAISDEAKALQNEEPNRLSLYNIFARYNHRIPNSQPELAIALNYMFQLLVEYIYETRPYLTPSMFKEICKVFGKQLQALSLAIKKRNRLKLYESLYNGFHAITELSHRINVPLQSNTNTR
ncbi:MAG: hypothetical protein QW385_03315 [Thermoproteota archaeon]